MRALNVLVLLGAVGVAAPAVAQGAWAPVPGTQVVQGRIDDVEIVSPDTLYASAGLGADLRRSTDGGVTWTSFHYAAAGSPRSLGFVSGTHGFLGMLGGPSLYETTDGGSTITLITDRIDGPVPFGVCGLFALDSLAVYGVGAYTGGAHFIRTLDAGQTWTSTDLGAQAEFLIDVYFHDRQHGLVVGRRDDGVTREAVVLGTDDGGTTWTERFRARPPGADAA